MILKILDTHIGELEWYRKWRGGHWERWIDAMTNEYTWYRSSTCLINAAEYLYGDQYVLICEEYNEIPHG